MISRVFHLVESGKRLDAESGSEGTLASCQLSKLLSDLYPTTLHWACKCLSVKFIERQIGGPHNRRHVTSCSKSVLIRVGPSGSEPVVKKFWLRLGCPLE